MGRAETFLESLSPEDRKRFWHLLTNPRLADVWQATVPHELDPWQREILAPVCEEWATEDGVFVAIHAPPQEGKSECVSERAPAYALACDPMVRCWLLSNNKAHATEFGESVRDLLSDDEFLEYFPRGGGARVDKLASGGRFKTAAREALVSNHASLTTAGLQRGGVVGKGPEKIIIDDPYAAPEEALSKAINEHVWNKWRKGIVARTKPVTSVLWMYHRYQPDDAMGRLIASIDRLKGRFRKVRFIRLPAVADDNDPPDDPTRVCEIADKELWVAGARSYFRMEGEMLSPRRSKKELDDLAEDDPEMYAGQYQGRPKPAGGTLIRREWLKDCDRAPKIDLWVRFWDLAVSREQTSDFTAGALVGIGPNQEIYLLDMVHFREQWGSAGEMIAEVMRSDKAWCDAIGADYWAGVEDVFWQDAMIQDMLKVCNLEGIQIQPVPTRGKGKKKEAASGWVLRARYGRFYMVHGKWDMQGFIDEAIVFTGNDTDKHDDRIDAVSGAYTLTWYIKGGHKDDEKVNDERQRNDDYDDDDF